MSRHLLLASLLAVALVAGCTSDMGGNDPTPATGTTTTPTGATPGSGSSMAVTVGTDAAFPPFEELSANGSFEGFDIDVMNEIARRNGWTVTFQNLPFDTLVQSVQNGQVDLAISAMSITDERSQVVDFSLPYYEANQSAAVRASDTNSYSSIESMKGKSLRFGAQSGTVGADIIVEEFGESSIRRYDTYPAAIQALKANEVDVVIMDAPAQNEAAKTDSAIKVVFEFSVGDVYGIAMQKGSDHRNAVNDAIEAMQDDGTLAQLREKWGI